MIRSSSIILCSIVYLFSIIPSAHAAFESCTYGGRMYRHGEVRDGYICQHGHWIPLS